MTVPVLNYVRHLRRDLLDLSQAEFAALMGVSVSTVSGWETADIEPPFWRVRELYRLARERGVEDAARIILEFEERDE